MGNSEIPAKREKCKAAYHKTSFTPWNPDNGYIGNDTDNPPKQAHDQAAKYKPEEISNNTHNLHLISNGRYISLSPCRIV